MVAEEMDGYDSSSYGRGFADVYDEWYADVTDVAATVRMMTTLAPGGRILELGIGTGRLAVPLAAAGLDVTGIDSSSEMLERLAARDPTRSVTAVHGDMVADLPDGPFDAALIAYNTIFNLLDDGAQARCFIEVARRLRAGGHFVVETNVSDPADGDIESASNVDVRSMSADRVVLSVSRHDPGTQRAFGQFIEITERDGVRLRPWSVRWASIEQLDEMAASAGFTLTSRSADMAGAPFAADGAQHVSVYRLGGGPHG